MKGRSPFINHLSPSCYEYISILRRGGTEGVRMIKNFKGVTNGENMEANYGGYLDYN